MAITVTKQLLWIAKRADEPTISMLVRETVHDGETLLSQQDASRFAPAEGEVAAQFEALFNALAAQQGFTT